MLALDQFRISFTQLTLIIEKIVSGVIVNGQVYILTAPGVIISED